MDKKLIIEFLVKQGLSEHLILHIVNNKVCLGHIMYDKNKLHLKDSGLLANVSPESVKPCWEIGVMGMITPTDKKKTWQSLTFLGLDYCKLPVDLSSTRQGVLKCAKNQYGETLDNFEGSIYRAFKLMLENHFLPVVLLHAIKSTTGIDGLAVTDLRMAPMDIKVIQQVNSIVTNAVEKRLSMGIEESEIDTSDFEKLFGNYLKN